MSLETNNSPSIPWRGVATLGRFWSGSGGVLEWTGSRDWDIERGWNAAAERARLAEAIIGQANFGLFLRLPRSLSQWLDNLVLDTRRTTELRNQPTSHTDWPATLSRFGRYPSPQYIERQSVRTHSSPTLDVLRWCIVQTEELDTLVASQFGRRVLSEKAKKCFQTFREIPDLLSATPPERPGEYELSICGSMGGFWPGIERYARRLKVITGDANFKELSDLLHLVPDIDAQLFEFGVVGTVASGIRAASPSARWTSLAPIGAARQGKPCLVADGTGHRWEVYYQTIPLSKRNASPYTSIGKLLGARPLRPDIWLQHHFEGSCEDVIIECKYSLDPSYVLSGLTDIFAYSVEFQDVLSSGACLVAVGPDELVPGEKTVQGRFSLISPTALERFVQEIAQVVA